MSTDPLAAIDPRVNAVVHAAAGTGKTWLLVSRLIRLLLAGAAPGSILAITFTVKAAAEMRIRLQQRLRDMCAADEADLNDMLRAVGVEPDAAACLRARGLYEQLLLAPHELRATTFHAFCQELLQRFAFEAGVPPAFEIIEQTDDIEAAAWHALDRDLHDDAGPLAQALGRLMRDADGPTNARRALSAFLAKRSEWWAYTEDMADPAVQSAAHLAQALAVDPTVDPLDVLARDTDVRQLAGTLAAGLRRHPGRLKTTLACLDQAATEDDAERFFRLLGRALFTEADEPRKFEPTKALTKALGQADTDAVVDAHGSLLDRVTAAKAQQHRHATYRRSRDWYLLGARLLEHYQRLKREQGLLDFSDLEWLAYRLLHHGRYADWVQYKLDRRIDHLLVDEFQDTNPTQWRLLLPLLEEMAAGNGERARSVFLVGDEKQSIYRFRRAAPGLLHRARTWLESRAAARTYEQDKSRRSSPAVIRFVNLLFEPTADGGETQAYQLPGFRAHDTHHGSLWGQVELLPLVAADDGAEAASGFRNPLEQPRRVAEDQRHRREGEMIAEKIKTLLGRPLPENGGARPLGCGDILVLLRDRRHAAAYEAALRHAGLPYVGAGRGNFLDCLEVRDLTHLLALLIAPFDDVALASVLRSPMFAATDDDLIALAGMAGGSWFDRLTARYRGVAGDAPLARAARLLTAWRAAADRVPVHDLLDRIYFDAAVPARYDRAAPAHLKARVAANLARLLDLALELDSGRFPSLARFLDRLALLTQDQNEALGGGQGGDQIRMLTIHGAKGLEAPVVFLVDAARPPRPREPAMNPLIDWPLDAPRPAHFVLAPRRHEADPLSRDLADRDARAAAQEESNLLYVAVTRAKHMLFVSGCEPGNRGRNAAAGDAARGWYGHIERRLQMPSPEDARRVGLALDVVSDPGGDTPFNVYGRVRHGTVPAVAGAGANGGAARRAVDPALTRPFAATDAPAAVAPSRLPLEIEDVEPEETARQAPAAAAIHRGVVIHRMLERLTAPGDDRAQARAAVWREFAGVADEERLAEYWAEACAVVDTPALRVFFDPTQYRYARNEVAVLYREGAREVAGVVDRLVVRNDGFVFIDYKTQRADPGEIPVLVERYTPQLRSYARGLQRLWPGKSMEAVLLLTALRRAVSVDVTAGE